MNEEDFTLAVKSTIDKRGVDIATQLNVSAFVDLDDTANAATKLQGTDNVIVWQFSSLDEDPFDPLYTLMFMVGAKTTTDPSNYTMMQFVSAVKAVFKNQTRIVIHDYSGEVAGLEAGDMFIVQSGVEQQEFDKESGYRFVAVVAKVVRKAV